MKIQMDIDDRYLYYLDVPEQIKNFTVVYYGYAGVWLMETDSTELNSWKVRLPNNSRYEVLGFIKNVIVGEVKTDKNFVLRIIK